MMKPRTLLSSSALHGADNEGESEEFADVSAVQEAIYGKIASCNTIYNSDYLSGNEMLDRFDSMNVNFARIMQDWEFFYRGMKYDRFFENNGKYYSLPSPKVTRHFMDELEKSYKDGEIDYIMIDDSRISDDDVADLAFFDVENKVRNLRSMGSFNAVDFFNNVSQLRNYLSYHKVMAHLLGKDDDQGVRVIGVKTENDNVDQVWKGVETLEKTLPNKPYYEFMSLGTLIRLCYYLYDYRTVIHGDYRCHEKLLSFLLGNGRRILHTPSPIVLNHFDINGNVVLARGTDDNRWLMERASLFTANAVAGNVGLVNVPVVMNSGGSVNVT
jgi:hypothetical protein